MDIQLLIGIIVFIIIVCVGLNKMDNSQENFETENVLCEKSDGSDETSSSNNCPVEPDYDPSEYAKKTDIEKDCPNVPNMSEYVLKSSIPSNHRCPSCICPKISANGISCGKIDKDLEKCKKHNKKLQNDLEQRPIQDCSHSNCAKLAKQNPGKICSKGDKPCIFIEKQVNIPKSEFSCPEVKPCVTTSEKNVVNIVQSMLDEPNQDNLTHLQTVNDLLEQINLESRQDLSDEVSKLEEQLKHLRQQQKQTTTHKPHHKPHHKPPHKPHHRKNNNNNNTIYNDYDYPTEYDNNRLEEKILEFEQKLKDTTNNLTTPSPTQLQHITTMAPEINDIFDPIKPSMSQTTLAPQNNIEEYDVDSYDATELQHILNNNTFGEVNKRCLQ